MKKCVKKFFGIKYDTNDYNYVNYRVSSRNTKHTPYEIIKEALRAIVINADIITPALVVTKLCNVINIDWLFVFIPLIIRIVIYGTFDFLDIWVNNKIAIERDKFLKAQESEYKERYAKLWKESEHEECFNTIEEDF